VIAIRPRIASAALMAGVFAAPFAAAQRGAANGEWRVIGADAGHSKYSPLDQVDRENAGQLEIAWTWTSIDERIQRANPDNAQLARATYFECTPIMIGGMLYGSTCLSQAFALDAATGETRWTFDSNGYKAGRPPNLGYISRGVAHWGEGDDARIFFVASDSWLYALDARTGRPIADFGDGGRVDLIAGVPRVFRGQGYGHPSAPVVCRGAVIVGSSISDGAIVKEAVPGRVKAFDVRTGAPLWTFNCIPEAGEFGTDTWDDDAWRYTGGANVWTNMSADEELGYVYLPTSTPTNDFYGGHRLGAGLFAESLVCLNAETGERVWHYQIVRHGVWDYDLPCAPNLIEIVVDGRPIKAVAQATKQGFLFVFDRVTGEPVWPIEERPVPASTVPGESLSPTQPVPTKPEPFTKQGMTEDDAIEFTPELRGAAVEILRGFHLGPLFTPPALDKPTLILPGYGGGANWPGCAFDPETRTMYIPSMNWPSLLFVAAPDPARSNFRYTRTFASMDGPDGLPLLKGPYAHIAALELDTGDLKWKVVNGGDGFRNHPRLRDLDLPPTGSNARAAVLVTKSLLFATEGSGRSGSATGGGTRLRALDKSTGAEVAAFDLLDQPTGVPMTYQWQGRQYIVVAVGSTPAQLVALALPGDR
jgi:quinoprotein glucose dehydrogenase